MGDEEEYDEYPEDFEDRFNLLKAQWKSALKKSKKLLLRCPNWERCQFKCGSVGGMTYHYVRCEGVCERFTCPRCSRVYESRTGLNYHMASNSCAGAPSNTQSDTPPVAEESCTSLTVTRRTAYHSLTKQPSKTSPTSSAKTTPTSSARTTPITSPKATPTVTTVPTLSLSPVVIPSSRRPYGSGRGRRGGRGRGRGRGGRKLSVKLDSAEPPAAVVTKPRGRGRGRGRGRSRGRGRVSVYPATSTQRESTITDELTTVDFESVDGQPPMEANIEYFEDSRKKKTASGAVVAITIPSIEYPDQYKTYLPLWRQEFKEEGLVHCPNYKDCGFKCTTVNGMKYHFVRCLKSDPPEFTCAVCKKKFQCRTGLVWHLKKHHDLINIQPTKGMAFTGTIPVEAYEHVRSSRLTSNSSDDSPAPVVRKRRRMEPRGVSGVVISGGANQEMGGASYEGGDWQRDDSSDRLKPRKQHKPRPTDHTYIQNVFDCYTLPIPSQLPPTTRERLRPCEYEVTDVIETEEFVYGSDELLLDESALVWRKMSDDSDSEGEEFYLDHSLPSPSLQSDSSLSDQSSDEEYMCPVSKSKPIKPKRSIQPKPSRVEEKKAHPLPSPFVPSEGDEEEEEFVRVKSRVMATPPHLIQTNQSVLREVSTDLVRKPVSKPVRLEAPPLIKTPGGVSSNRFSTVATASHHRSSPGDIKVVPGSVVGGAMGMAKSHEQAIPKLKAKPDQSFTPVVNMPRIQPQVILSAGVQRPPPPLVSSKSRDQSRDTRGHAHSASSSPSLHKPQSSQRPTKRVAIDPSLLGPSAKPSKIVTPLSHKKAKPHPQHYGVVTANPTHSHSSHKSHSSSSSPASQVTMATTTSYPTVQLPTNLHRVMTPLQLVSPTQASDPHSMATSSPGVATYQPAVGSGGLIFLQGAAPQAATYISSGGQTYQVINQGTGESAQKVSVIMQPTAGTTFLAPADLQGGSIQYIGQLDGPPDQETSTERIDQERNDLQKNQSDFEKMRTREQEKLGLTSVSQSAGEPEFQAPQNAAGVAPRGQSAEVRGQSQEELMSEKLKSYLTREKARKGGVASESPLATAETNSAANHESASPPKRKKGRPRKSAIAETSGSGQSSSGIVNIETETAQQDTSRPLSSRTRKRTHRAIVQDDSDSIAGQSESDVGTPKKPRGRRKKEEGGEQPRPFACKECEKSFPTNYFLQVHIDTDHPPNLGPDASLEDYLPMWKRSLKRTKQIRCHMCSVYKATSLPSMKYHFSRCGKTQEELLISCDVCGKTYTTKAGLAYHTKSRHSTPANDESSPAVSVATPPDTPTNLVSVERVAARKARDRLHTLINQLRPPDNDAGTHSSITMETGSPRGVAMETESPVANGDKLSKSPSPMVGKAAADWDKSVVTREEMTMLRKKFNDSGGPLNCPVKGCSKVFTTFPGIRYHLLHHNTGRHTVRTCPKCGKKFLGTKKLNRHTFKKHTDDTAAILENPSDEEYNPEQGKGWLFESSDSPDTSDGSEGSDIDTPSEDESGGVLRPQRKRNVSCSSVIGPLKSNVPIRYHSGKVTYTEFVKDVLKRVRGREDEGGVFFSDWMPHPSDWAELSQSEVSQHCPNCAPVTFSLHTSSISHPHTNHTLSWDSTPSLVSDGYGAIFSAGGPVWAMDWAPVSTSTANQILAVAPYRNSYNFFQMESAFAIKGSIQIWDIGQISMETETLPTPHLSLTVAHEFGVVRQLKWCPSGCHDNSTEGECWSRIGLLAVASSDGFARIISVPHVKKEGGGDGLISSTAVKIESVSAVLVPYGMHAPNTTPTFQCLCVDWSPSNNHSRIAGGFSNGMVCVWDLDCKFQIKPTQDGRGRIVHPLIDIAAQNSLCSSLAWCPLEPNYLCTGGKDRAVNVWDIRQPATPIDTHRGAFFQRELGWSLLWPAVFSVAGMSSTVQLISYYHQSPGSRPTRGMSDNYAPVSSMSYCPWSDRLAAATFSGELTVTTIPTNFYSNSLQKLDLSRIHKVVLDTKVVVEREKERGHEGESEGEREALMYVHNPKKTVGEYSVQQPLLPSINLVRWNGNETCHEWLAIGTNSGLVHILRVPKPSEKPDLYSHRRKNKK